MDATPPKTDTARGTSPKRTSPHLLTIRCSQGLDMALSALCDLYMKSKAEVLQMLIDHWCSCEGGMGTNTKEEIQALVESRIDKVHEAIKVMAAPPDESIKRGRPRNGAEADNE